MVNDSSAGGSLSAGAPKDVPIPDAQTTNAAANYANMITAVNTNLSGLTAAAGRGDRHPARGPLSSRR